MVVQYTKGMFIERVERHIADGFPSEEFSVFSNEILLYLDSEIAANLVGSMIGMNKITGAMATPEAYIVTTELGALLQNTAGEWYATLPQTPISLSLGHSVTNAYFVDVANGVSQPIWLIKSNRVGFRSYLPSASGVKGSVRGNAIYLRAKDNMPLSNLTVYVDMVSTRTNDLTEPMNLPDDVMSVVFDKVVAKCMARLLGPKDTVKDDNGVLTK